MASVDPCFLIDITDIDIGLVIFSLKWKPDCIFFTIFASKYRQVAENSACCKASVSESREPV